MKSFRENRSRISAFLTAFMLCVLQCIPTSALAYPPYTANSNIVQVAPYDTARSGAANWGYSTATGSQIREFLTVGQQYRIRQDGTISQVRLYTANKTNITGFYVKIWRQSGSTFNLVGASNNIVSSLTAGTGTTISLGTPITGVQEGDYYGYRIEVSGANTSFFARTGIGGVTSYYVNNVTPSTSNYAWTSKTAVANTVLPIELDMQAPQAVFIGDSIISGHYTHFSFIETTATTNIASTLERKFSNLTGYTYQNMGIGGQETSAIAARFTADVLNQKPRIAIIEGGVNDVFDDVPKSTFMANWAQMLDAAQANSSVTTVVVLKIMPWTEGSNAQLRTTDDWNNSLATLAAGYSKAVVVDTSSYVGQFRAGGDPGNLWDIQTAYNQDDVHFTPAGNAQIAQAIADALASTSTTLVSDYNPSFDTSYVTLTATVHAAALGAGTATGTLVFKDGANTIGSIILGHGSGSFTTNSLSVGSHALTAVYAGNSSFMASTSNTVTQLVRPLVASNNETQSVGGTRGGSSGGNHTANSIIQHNSTSSSAASSTSSFTSIPQNHAPTVSTAATAFQARAALLDHIIARTVSANRRMLLQSALDLVERTIARLLK